MSKKFLIIGCNGQLGKLMAIRYPEARAVGRQELDISNKGEVESFDWTQYDVVINAAAYVNADKSETQQWRRVTWKANAIGPANLAKIAIENKLHLIHISSEYVFDGSKKNHSEDEPFSPLSVYGQSKAAGDIAVGLVPKHHILRTSWVVGGGHNFVRTMKNLADLRIDPKVVNDQYGRLTFTSEIVRAVDHLLLNKVESGTYNLSNSGKIRSWAEIAAYTFELAGHDKSRVEFVSTSEYKKDKRLFAPRPIYSDMDLSKIRSTGFKSNDYDDLLKEYIISLGVNRGSEN